MTLDRQKSPTASLARFWWKWIAAAAAWALGMPVIFLGAQANEIGANETVTGIAVAASLLIAGVVVGAVHGRFLVWMVQLRAK